MITVPEPAVLSIENLPMLRVARSRMLCRPKCPCLPRRTISGSMPIREFNSQQRGVRVYAGVADRLISDAIYLVTDHGMHLLNLPGRLKRDFHWAMNAADQTPAAWRRAHRWRHDEQAISVLRYSKKNGPFSRYACPLAGGGIGQIGRPEFGEGAVETILPQNIVGIHPPIG